MTLLLICAGLNLLTTIALAVWTIRRVKRLRISVKLAHGDIRDITHSLWAQSFG